MKRAALVDISTTATEILGVDPLTGTIWLVTGTSSGLGKCLVTSVLSRGDCVVATVRKPSSLDDLALTEEQKGRLRVLILDITDSEENIRKLIGEAWVVWGRVDILVNNAGRASTKALMEEGGLELMRAEYETNVFGTMKVTNAVLPHMRQRKSGLIVFLGSRVVWQANTPVASSYISSKAAIHGTSPSAFSTPAQDRTTNSSSHQ
ncbi:uncharacterized protein B0H18DRAFT_451691 [Fomitopsis serialis]|uniref:uncharacterized protein n=1 Tax=Fomitopsis serialis TaxID=139415 RepID=UPI002007A146|nr:uncharacterized protein B0H18DRAFT_451691 [Neoantrodia serialis]KAH9923887.1 hypothetical protein B0H18DRAFT_451691 [Neoantrodia serialis]